MKQLCILGRQPAIGIAELEALYGADNLEVCSPSSVQVTTDQPIHFRRLGGTIKIAKPLKELPGYSFTQACEYLSKTIPQHVKHLPDGKLKLGLSLYDDATVSLSTLTAQLLRLKKPIKQAGRSVRIVENKSLVLDAAQVIYNKLTKELGWELLLIKTKSGFMLAQTTAVQDINDYTVRDRGRPKRDARIGMLPPKLAQIIINLASYTLDTKKTILDPFCGTGVLLQEALLMGYSVYGTDNNDRMIQYSRENLQWLEKKYDLRAAWDLAEADATKATWKQPIDSVACETYLGRPFTTPPDSALLQKNRADCDTIIRKFLQNIGSQLSSGTRLCIAVPAWFMGNSVFHLATLGDLEIIGYNQISFVHAPRTDLIYHREDQIVGRELVVLARR